jgi:transposase
MAKQRKSYTREFKLEAVRLLETSGRGVTELERELGIGAGCLGRWRAAFREEGEQAFPGHGHPSPDEERIRALEREVEILRQEREILKKAVAIFSHPRR